MAHKTLIGGTAYEIAGGRTLVNGTGYDIKAGKTLVGGTAYDVSFGEPVTVNVIQLPNCTVNTNNVHVVVNGVKYTGTQTGLQVMSGDTIQFYINSTASQFTSSVKINGTTVKSVGGAAATYDWTVPDGVKSVSIEFYHHTGYWAKAIVNTSEKTTADVTITTNVGGDSSYCYVTINGTKYTSAASGIVVQHGDVITVRTRGNASGVGAFVDKTENIYLSGEDANKNYTTSWYVPSVSNITFQLTYTTFDGKGGQIYLYKS